MCSETFHEFHRFSVREEIWYPGREYVKMISLAIWWLLLGLVLGFSMCAFPFSMTLKSNDCQLSGTMLEWTLLNKEMFSATTSKYLITYWCCWETKGIFFLLDIQHKADSWPCISVLGFKWHLEIVISNQHEVE